MVSMNEASFFDKNRSDQFARDDLSRRSFIGQGIACVLASAFTLSILAKDLGAVGVAGRANMPRLSRDGGFGENWFPQT